MYQEIGSPYHQDIQFRKISEQTDFPLGNSQAQDSCSLEMKPQKSKSKDLSCDVCFKKLSSNDALRNHKRLHTGEKPFNCNHCEEAFVRKPQLVRHMTKAHGIN